MQSKVMVSVVEHPGRKLPLSLPISRNSVPFQRHWWPKGKGWKFRYWIHLGTHIFESQELLNFFFFFFLVWSKKERDDLREEVTKQNTPDSLPLFFFWPLEKGHYLEILLWNLLNFQNFWISLSNIEGLKLLVFKIS